MSELPRGMQIMVQTLIKMVGLDPARVQNSIDELSKSVQSAAADMAIIRRQNSAIMAHLGIAEPSSLEQHLVPIERERPN